MGAGQPPVLALDIGGTKLAVAVVTEDGETHGLVIEPTRREEGPGIVIPRLLAMGHKSIQAARLDEPIAAVGISCGGPLDAPSGVLLCPPHLPGWIDIPLGDQVSTEYGVPFVLENDATAAALAEHRYGAGRGTETMLYLTISTGVGGGAVINGQLHHGAAGNGGEYGHIMVRPGGRLCSCGRAGCLEAYASGSAIAERAAEALAAGRRSTLGDLVGVTAADVSQRALAGDPLAGELWGDAIDALGIALTDLVNVFEPELVVLGGGVTRAGAQLLDPLRAIIADSAMGPAGRTAVLELAELGDVVCVVGAGAVAFDSIKETLNV